MEHNNKLWSKVKGWVARSGRTRNHAADSVEQHSLGESPAEEKATTTHSLDRFGLLSRRKHNEETLERLQAGYDQVIDLISSIKEHQKKQEARATEISNALSQMAVSLNSIEGGSRLQSEKLALIAEGLHTTNERAERWEEILAEFPRVAEAQKEALTGVVQQLSAAGERDDRMTSSLDSFREVVVSLGEATTASSVAVKNLQMSTLEGHDRTAALMKEQNKRFTMLFIVTLVLVVVSVATATMALFSK